MLFPRFGWLVALFLCACSSLPAIRKAPTLLKLETWSIKSSPKESNNVTVTNAAANKTLMEPIVQTNLSADVENESVTNTTTQSSARYAAKMLSKSKVAVGPKYKDFWLVISTSLKLAVTIVPKVMCSSVRAAFNTRECSGVPEKRCAEVRINHELAKATDMASTTRIAFVRDPFERALSAYQNSDTNHYIHINHCNNTRQCNFTAWVKELARNPQDTFTNEHFLPQSRVLQFDQIQYQYLFRLSSASDQDFFWNKLCKRKKAIIANEVRNKALPLDLFTNETFTIISQLYAEDLVLWRKVLQYGTPPAENESTLYDYYVANIRNVTR